MIFMPGKIGVFSLKFDYLRYLIFYLDEKYENI